MSTQLKQQLWHNIDNGRCALVKEAIHRDIDNNIIGGKGFSTTRDVYMNGADARKRINYSTGVIGFTKRQQLAASMGGAPLDAKQPAFMAHANKNLYTPSGGKFDGYSQYPRPVVRPYQNKIDYTSEV